MEFEALVIISENAQQSWVCFHEGRDGIFVEEGGDSQVEMIWKLAKEGATASATARGLEGRSRWWWG